jgi:glycosyltransferase involved in cell wall biosynthesis
MSAPLVTVLMSVYNGGSYLKEAIASVLGQTFKDFELLIINDCSQDNSVAVIDSFKDARIRLINNDVNLGQTRSLNLGLSLALGRYIARIDADDIVFPRWLEKNLVLLKQQPLTAVVSSKAVVIDGQNKIQKTLNTPCCYEEMILRCLTATPLNHVGAVYKTDVIASLGGYDENFKIAADFELWSNLIRRGIRLASSDEILVAVRAHGKSVSAIERGRADIVEISQVMSKNFNALVSFGFSQEDIALLWKLNYATSQLSVQEFKSALAFLFKAYENLKPQFAVSLEVAKAYRAQREKVFYAKRALGQMSDGQLTQLRALAFDYGKSRGYFNVFSLLWMGSWLGEAIMKNVPEVFEHLNGWSSHQKIQKYTTESKFTKRACEGVTV